VIYAKDMVDKPAKEKRSLLSLGKENTLFNAGVIELCKTIRPSGKLPMLAMAKKISAILELFPQRRVPRTFGKLFGPTTPRKTFLNSSLQIFPQRIQNIRLTPWKLNWTFSMSVLSCEKVHKILIKSTTYTCISKE